MQLQHLRKILPKIEDNVEMTDTAEDTESELTAPMKTLPKVTKVTMRKREMTDEKNGRPFTIDGLAPRPSHINQNLESAVTTCSRAVGYAVRCSVLYWCFEK
jgi:hypothetical protein